MPYKDPEQRKACHKRWRDANPEKIAANVKKWRTENPERVRELGRIYTKQWRLENREAWDDIQRRTKYGIEPADFKRMKLEQNNLCAVCLEDKALNVDHDHKTGKVRGLLCGDCNTGLGKLKDNSVNLLRAAAYLKEKS